MNSISRMLTRREQALLLFFGIALVLGVFSIWWLRGEKTPETSPLPERASTETAARPAETVSWSSVSSARSTVATPSGDFAADDPPSRAAGTSPGQSGETLPVTAIAPPTGTPSVPVEKESDLNKTSKEIAVAVRGGVIREGLYRLPPDSRVADLIEKAGGTRSGANLSMINLAAPLVDGTTLTVPMYPDAVRDRETVTPEQFAYLTNPVNPSCYLITAQPDGVSAPEAASRGALADTDPAFQPPPSRPAAQVSPQTGESGRINLNTASQAELEQLPGIGPKLAQQIIAYRSRQPFNSVEDLDAVPGFGPKRIEAIRDLVTAP